MPSPRWEPLLIDGAFSPSLKRHAHVASGAYAVRKTDGHEVVYVGESSRGTLWRTLLRHFQAPDSFRKVRERGIFTGDAAKYEVAVHVTSRGHRPRGPAKGSPKSVRIRELERRGIDFTTKGDQRALDLQAEWIASLKPTINVDDGLAEDDELEEECPECAGAGEDLAGNTCKECGGAGRLRVMNPGDPDDYDEWKDGQKVISPKEAASLGWERYDPRPWTKGGARWRGPEGWELHNCGHPTALWPWALYDPQGRMVLSGARHGDPTKGKAWPSLRRAMYWLAGELARQGRPAAPIVAAAAAETGPQLRMFNPAAHAIGCDLDEYCLCGARVGNPPAIPPPNVAPEKRAENRTPDLWTGRTKLEDGGKGPRRDWKGEAERTARELAECRRAVSSPSSPPALPPSLTPPLPPPPRPEGYGVTDDKGQASMFKRNPCIAIHLFDRYWGQGAHRIRIAACGARPTFKRPNQPQTTEDPSQVTCEKCLVIMANRAHAGDKRNPGGIMDLDLRDLVGSDMTPPFSVSRGNRAKHQNAVVRGFYRRMPKAPLVRWEGAAYESLDEKELSSWLVKALTALHEFRFGSTPVLLPGSTSSTKDEAAFWLRLIAAMPAVEIPLTARPWRGENDRSGTDGYFGEVVRLVPGMRSPTMVALAADEGVARRVALLAELTDYAVLLKALKGKKRNETEALKRAEEWTGDPDTRARWIRLAGWLRDVGDDLPEIQLGERKAHLAKISAAAEYAAEREATRDKRRWPRFAVGDLITARAVSVFGGEHAVVEAASRGSHEYANAAPEYHARTIGRGVLYACNEDQGLESAPSEAWRPYVLGLVEAGPAHSLAVAELVGKRREVADGLALSGLLKRLAARGRWPDRYVVTASGSHALGTFASDDRNFRDESIDINNAARKKRLAREAAALRVRPAGFGDVETKGKKAGQIKMFNPGAPPPKGKLTELGVLTELGAGSELLTWSLRDAPVLAYDKSTPARLFIVYAGKVARPSSPDELREYARTHWGAKGKGDCRDGGRAVGPFRALGLGTSIQYTTKKGGDRQLVNYVHEWGEGGPKKFTPPTIVEHVCKGGCKPRCGAKGALALAGGSYTVNDRGIVG